MRVTTAFRTPLGGAVIMPGGSVDFVQLDGEGEEDVRDVTLEGGQIAGLPGTEPAEQLVELVPLDRRGTELDTTVDVPAGGSVTVDLAPETVQLLRKHGRTSFVTLRPVAAPQNS